VVHGAKALDWNWRCDPDWCFIGGHVGTQFCDRVRQYVGARYGASDGGLAKFGRSRFDVFVDAVGVHRVVLVFPSGRCEIPRRLASGDTDGVVDWRQSLLGWILFAVFFHQRGLWSGRIVGRVADLVVHRRAVSFLWRVVEPSLDLALESDTIEVVRRTK